MEAAIESRTTQKQYTWKDIENEIGLSRSWVLKMEAEGLLHIRAPKGTGRVARPFTHGEVVNMLRLAALRLAGFTPEHLRRYRKSVMDFHKVLKKYQRNLKRRWNEEPVLLFHIEDFFPNGFDAVDWKKFSKEDLYLLAKHLDQAWREGMAAQELVEDYRRKTESTLKSLNATMKRLKDEFLNPVKEILFDNLYKMANINPFSGESMG